MPKSPSASYVRIVKVTARAAKRLHAGHPWVYSSDLPEKDADSIPAAALVHVADERGRFLGSALSSSASQIALRLLSHKEKLEEKQLSALIRERMAAALSYRQRVVRDSDAYRVVFSEADALPGVIVDRYHDVLTIQMLTQAMDRDDLRAAVLQALVSAFGSGVSIVERAEARIRELEKLPPMENRLLAGEKSMTQFTMNGLRFHFDAMGGQKSGAFLDQRENYAAAALYGFGDALDVFTYHGGFALHLARVCKSVTGVDASRPALEQAEANAKDQANASQFQCGEIEWLEANAFDLLKDFASTGKQYDTIVLDPPAFAKSKRTLETALRGYKELNLRALKMLRPGGVLITCSCSHHVSEDDFLEMLASAANDAGRTVRMLEKRGQSKDHPMVLNIPETAYLKCIIGTVE